jgi:multidrug efflux pump subunit AcrA (membrane-fusion protein)
MKDLGLFVVVLLSLAGCSRQSGAQAAEGQKPRAVKTEQAQIRDVRRQVDIIGTLAAREEVVVSAEVDGRVARLVHDLGDRVTAGGPLIELDQEKLQYRAEAQRAALEQARARYGASGDGALPPLEQVPAVVSTSAQLADAQQQLERARNLSAQNLLARSDLDTAQTRFNTAKAAHDQALASARQLRADIESQSSSLRLAQRNLRDAVIRAPFDGYVAERLVSQGQYIQTQAPVMRIVRLQPLKITAEVPEKFAPWIQTGRELSVRVDAYPSQVFAGKVVRISPAVNLRSRAFAIEGEVPNADGRLKPGTFARVQISTDQVDRAVTIPAAAVQSRYGTNRVFLVQNGQLAGKEVVLGDRLGDRVEVAQGLAPGTAIVAADVEQLAEGMKITATANSQLPTPSSQGAK